MSYASDVTYQQRRAEWLCGGGGGCYTRLPPSLFWNLLVFWQNVLVKFPDPMLSVNLEYFIIKNEMQNFINIQSRRNQTFTGDDGFYKSYIRFSPTIMIIINI